MNRMTGEEIARRLCYRDRRNPLSKDPAYAMSAERTYYCECKNCMDGQSELADECFRLMNEIEDLRIALEESREREDMFR